MRTKHFHEDDYCQQELLPVSVWEYCAAELGKIDAFAEAHRAGQGWTEMYIRPAPPAGLKSLSIGVSALAEAVRLVLPPYDRVTTGYSTHAEPRPSTRAFGTDHGFTLFLDEDASGHVVAGWIAPRDTDPAEVGPLVELLASLPWAGDLLLVDWAQSHLLRVSDGDAWRHYLSAHIKPEGR